MHAVSTADVGEDTVSVSDLIVEFGGWLDRQRGLAPITIHNYCQHAGQFLAALPQPTQVSVSLLDAGTVTAFMVEYCRDRNTNSAKSMVRSVRSFLRFAHATGRTSTGLWSAVPSSSGWHLASLPRSVPAADLEHLVAVASRSRFTATDLRDYAILLLLARLGLRRGEVAALGLDDIDWRAGEITVVGKGNRVERLPLPAEPGEAIAAWLTDGRPRCQTRAVFTTLRPAGRPLSSGAVGHVVGTACRTAGIGRIGAHRLRHSAAMALMSAGVDTSVIALWLGHQSAATTDIYLHADMTIKETALARVAQPHTNPGRYRPADPLIDFLERL